MTLKRILRDIDSANRQDKTSITVWSHFSFKKISNVLKEYGFCVKLCTDKANSKYWMSVVWDREVEVL